MYDESSNGGMSKIESRVVDFLKSFILWDKPYWYDPSKVKFGF
jgi:hypothetical protein